MKNQLLYITAVVAWTTSTRSILVKKQSSNQNH